jgi:hypothetical protein
MGAINDDGATTMSKSKDMSAATAIVQMFELSRMMLLKGVSDLTEEQWFHQPVEGLASAAWIIGHAVLIDRHVLHELETHAGSKDFILPDLPYSWEIRFASRCDEQDFESPFDAREIVGAFSSHRDILLLALADVSNSTLDSTLEPPSDYHYSQLSGDDEALFFAYRTIGEMAIKMAQYMFSLTGELSMCRQSLGLTPIDEDWL